MEPTAGSRRLLGLLFTAVGSKLAAGWAAASGETPASMAKVCRLLLRWKAAALHRLHRLWHLLVLDWLVMLLALLGNCEAPPPTLPTPPPLPMLPRLLKLAALAWIAAAK